MSDNFVSYEEAKECLGVPPSLAPRPNCRNIYALERHLTEKCEGIPNITSPNHGFGGMVEEAALFNTRTGETFVPHADPGAHPVTHDANNAPLDADAARAARVLYTANNSAWQSQRNVQRATIDALNTAVPRSYKRAENSMNLGVLSYKITSDPRTIIQRLRAVYGIATPQEKEENDRRFNEGWPASQPIEELWDRLEECYAIALMSKPAYTVDQLLDKAKTKITKTGLFSRDILEWNGFDENAKTWPMFKSHFNDAYNLWISSGGGTAAQHGYHGANNADGDDDSWATVEESFVTKIGEVQQANNAKLRATNDNVSTLSGSVAGISQQLMALQQQLANLSMAKPNAPYAPPPVAYVPTAPAYQPTYQPPNSLGGGGGGRGGRPRRDRGQGGRAYGGRGRGGAQGGWGGSYMQQPAPAGGIPPPMQPPPGFQQRGRNAPNPVKRFANWNMCFSCGFDVEDGHTSATCPYERRRPGHQEGCTRDNWEQYDNAGHHVRKTRRHKNVFPSA